MSDEEQNLPEEEMSFADMLAAYDDGRSETLQIGDKVSVKIIAIGRESVFVDTGTKIDGTVDRAELTAEDGELSCTVGDALDLYVVDMKEGEIHLSKALAGAGGLELLREARHSQMPVEGKVQATCKGGFEILMVQRRAFCPVSQMDARYVENPEDYVGQDLLFLITRFEENGRNIVVSRRRLLEKEQAEAQQAFLATTAPGALCDGKITRIVPFGAFVELIPGLEGLVHISELAWSRVEDPKDVVAEGQTVTVKILGIEDGDKPGRKKIALSVKQALGDPWQTDIERFQPEMVVPARITRCMPFGAFAELLPGIEGLIHISALSFTRHVRKPEDIVAPGESVTVMIKSIDRENRKIALSLKDVAGDPWQSVSDKYREGQIIEGLVEKRAGFGLLITLEPGITGLLPKSRIGEARAPGRIETMKPGDKLAVVIEKIDADQRRISLGPGDRAEDKNWQQFSPASGGKSMGALAEKLQAALDARKKS
ncbi:MAG: 30S ribosomal protein S1 [Desulfosarcina sp.]|nr:30S ribosomal protein S1 [Desulfobacterales bacterium]